jgi:prepilin-type N-terminal cleavage/methylation domain-containing protein
MQRRWRVIIRREALEIIGLTGLGNSKWTFGRNSVRKRIGFTLIELLIVVAIIAILAAIAVPNFLEAQTRAKVSRVQSDMRSIAVALESYGVDGNGKYPPRVRKTGAVGVLRVGDALLIAQDVSKLTTPIAYITSYPKDVFKDGDKTPNDILDYWNESITLDVRKTRLADPNNLFSKPPSWCLFSIGPDRVFGQSADISNYSLSKDATFFLDYDPTNGSVSLGNVFRFRTQGNANDYFNRR